MAKKGPRQITRKRLSFKQKEKLAEFFTNFAVAWLATGLISPYVAGKSLAEGVKPAIMSLFWTWFSLTAMLYLVKEKK